MFKFIKNNFLLSNKITDHKKIFNIVVKNIPGTIFSILDHNFLRKIEKKKILEIFTIKKENKICSIISVISIENYVNLKKEIVLYLILHPYKLIRYIFFIYSQTSRKSISFKLNKKKNYLHLLHLIIFKDKFKKMSLLNKDKLINFFFKKIIKKYNAKYFFLCYEKDNFRAHKFYKRNKFKIYVKIKNSIFTKKEFK